MTFAPKLVALDIDGTVVDGSGHLPDDVRSAVRRVLDADVPVVLATGRGWEATQPIFDALGLPPGWAVSANGAVVVQYPPLEVRREVTFDAREIIARVAQILPQSRLCVERGMERYATREFPPGELSGDVVLVPVEELGREPVSRLIIRQPESEHDTEIFDELIAELGMHEVGYFVGWSAWMDIAPVGVDKSSGLEMVCEALGVAPSDVLALGDGNNDIEMLTWAGRGVAMGDSPDAVKEAADHVTSDFADGGTAEELARWF